MFWACTGGDKLIKCWRMATGDNRTADETGIFIHGLFDASGVNAKDIEAVIIFFRRAGHYVFADAGDTEISGYRTDDCERGHENGHRNQAG